MSHLVLTAEQRDVHQKWLPTLGPIYPVDETTAVIVVSQPCAIPGYRAELRLDAKGYLIFPNGANRLMGGLWIVPIPTKTTYAFTGECTIKKIFFSVVPGGFFTERTGGVGQRNWSIVFESQNAQLRPTVEVSVLKKEYYAARLLELNNRKLASITALTELQKSLGQVENSVMQLEAAIQQKQEEKRALTQQVNLINSELQVVRTQLIARRGEVERSLQILKEMGGKIGGLIKFLKLCPQIDFPIGCQEISAFQEIIPGLQELVGEMDDPQCLFSKISKELDPLIQENRPFVGKELIGVLGPTGAAKSTLVNHLLDVPLVFRNKRVEVVNPTQEIAKIGHSTTVSETLLAKVYSASGSPFVFADCGGFFDTRGILENILTIASAKLTLSVAGNLRLVFCMDVSSIGVERGNKLIENLIILKTLLKGLNPDDKSTLILFTHPYIDLLTGECVSQETVLEQLKGLEQTRVEAEEKELIRFLLRDEGKYVQVYDPLSDGSKNAISQLLGQLSKIQTPKQAIQGSYSADSVRSLREEALPLAIRSTSAYAAYQTKKALYRQLEIQENQLVQKKAQLDARVNEATQFIQEKEALKSPQVQQLPNLRSQIQKKAKEGDDDNSEITKLNTNDLLIFQGNGKGWTIKNPTT